MKRILFITIGLSVFFSSCTESAKNDTSKQIAISSEPNVQEKKSDESPLFIDDDYIQASSISSDNKKLADKSLFKLNAFTRLKDGQDQFTYYILKELNFGDSFKSFLIYEDYESESAVWLANYDKDYNLIDAIEVYYDNAEGAWSTTSKIYEKQHLVEVTKNNIYETPETIKQEVKIASSGKIEQ